MILTGKPTYAGNMPCGTATPDDQGVVSIDTAGRKGQPGQGLSHLEPLALLLAGPALSLPNMLVLIKLMGGKKTFVFCSLIVVAATAVGMIYGTTQPGTVIAQAGSVP